MPSEQNTHNHTVDVSAFELPPGSVLPNYTGGGIVNLMSSIAGAFGVESQWSEASLLKNTPVGRRVVMLVIDGLGIDHLRKGLPDGFLAQHCLGSLTSVSPSATAAAIPVYLTAEPPAVHGFPGWFTWFEELSTTAAILPYATRAGFLPLSKCAITPSILSGVQPFTSKIGAPSWVVSPKRIANSTFNKCFSVNASILPFDDINHFTKNIVKACKSITEDGYIYAYWSEYDHTAHGYGVRSGETQLHLEMLDANIEKLAKQLKGMDIDLLISADHGFTDCPDDKQFILGRDFPKLQKMLKMPLTGEPRLATAHVKNSFNDRFIEIANSTLQGVASVVSTEEYVNAGLLGGRKTHEQLLNRMGDAIIMMHPNSVILDPLPGEQAPRLIGHHGGLSPEEMLVPLIVCHC